MVIWVILCRPQHESLPDSVRWVEPVLGLTEEVRLTGNLWNDGWHVTDSGDFNDLANKLASGDRLDGQLVA
jgi:hypothetical protein